MMASLRASHLHAAIPHRRSRASLTLPLEELDSALVLLGRRSGLEGPKVSALAGPGIFLIRVQPVFAAFQFPNHTDLTKLS